MPDVSRQHTSGSGCAAALVLGLLVLAGVIATSQLKTLEAVVLAFGLGVPAGIALVWALLANAGRALVARAAGLKDVSSMRGGLGLLFLVRGRAAGGRAVRIVGRRVEVDLDAPPPGEAEYSRAALDRLAVKGGPGRAQKAAAVLLVLGVKRVVVQGCTVVVEGGSAAAAHLVEPAVALALSPVRVRFAPKVASTTTCPYCHGGFDRVRVDPAVRCDVCDVRQHTGCWQEHGGCAVFRCRRGPADGHERPARIARLGEVAAPEIGRSGASTASPTPVTP